MVLLVAFFSPMACVTSEVRNQHSITRQVKALDSCRIDLPAPFTSPATIPEHATVLVPVKAYQVEAALLSLSGRVNPSHSIVLMHNGMGSQQWVEKFLPDEHVYYATTSHAAKKTQDKVQITGAGKTFLGPATLNAKNNKKRGKDVATVLDSLVPPVTLCDDIDAILWRKLVVNAVINPLTAINNVPNGELASDTYRNDIAQLIEQSAEVIAASGVALYKAELQQTVEEVIKHTASNHSSMLQDVLHNRKTEIQAISGFMVKAGKKLGIDVSAHQSMLEQVEALESHYTQ